MVFIAFSSRPLFPAYEASLIRFGPSYYSGFDVSLWGETFAFVKFLCKIINVLNVVPMNGEIGKGRRSAEHCLVKFLNSEKWLKESVQTYSSQSQLYRCDSGP